MNEVDAEARRVRARHVAHVIAELILLLVAHYRKCGDGRGELVVAKGFESRNRAERRAERKCECVAEIAVARLRDVRAAGVKGERPKPRWAERVLVPDHTIHVFVAL